MLGQAGVTASRAAHKPVDPDVGWLHTVVDMTMPPANAREVRRENDDELLGLLLPAGDQRWWLAGTIKRDEYNGGNAAEMHLEDAAVA